MVFIQPKTLVGNPQQRDAGAQHDHYFGITPEQCLRHHIQQCDGNQLRTIRLAVGSVPAVNVTTIGVTPQQLCAAMTIGDMLPKEVTSECHRRSASFTIDDIRQSCF